MRVSWNWLSNWVDLSELAGPEALSGLLTARGLEVEAVERQDQGFEKVVVAQILSREKHPQADRLNLCQVSLGNPAHPLQIVCGAQNMKAGDHVALAQVGALLPNGAKISESKIRGVLSQGMLCSEQELKLASTSEGILILPTSTLVGTPLAQVLGRDDTIFVLKLTVNRGDCLSHLGMAREVAAALGKKLKSDWRTLPAAGHRSLPGSAQRPVQQAVSEKCPIQVSIEASEQVPQFYGCYIEGVQIGPSPDWMVKRLEALGTRSINNVVDATNWAMLELGSPTHAYDADRIRGKKIQARFARENEELVLLDGARITLTGAEIVIADQEGAIGLGGVMGGESSEIQPSTSRVFVECAEFNPTLVRKSAVLHQHKTEASHRFERGVDPLGVSRTFERVVSLIIHLAGGKRCGDFAFQHPNRTQVSPLEIRLDTYAIHDFLGFKREEPLLEQKKIQKILEGLDCQVTQEGSTWKVNPPSYRFDLKIKEDIIEEVARTVGYDLIPTTLPQLTSSPISSLSAFSNLTLLDRAKEALVKNGFCEAVHLSFTSRAWLDELGLESSVKLLNPLSEEYEMMIPSLLPGLIRTTLNNWNHHFGSEALAIRLFELRPVFSSLSKIHATNKSVSESKREFQSDGQAELSGKFEVQGETGVAEQWKLSLILSGPRFAGGLKNDLGEVDFYDLKATVESLLRDLGVRGIRYLPLSEKGQLSHLFHPGKSIEVWAGDTALGTIGLLHPKKALELKARSSMWMAELDWEALKRRGRGAFEVPSYKPSPEFPPMERDFALLVRQEISCEKICQLALKLGKPLVKIAKVFDIYRGSQVPEGMTSIAVRVIFYDEGRSLTENEAESASAHLIEGWKKELGVELRG